MFAPVGVPQYDQHHGKHTLGFSVVVRAGSNEKRWKTIRWHYPQVYESKRAATSWATVVLEVLAATQHNGAAAAIPVLGTATLSGPALRRKGVVAGRASKRRSYEGQNIGRAEHKLKSMTLEPEEEEEMLLPSPSPLQQWGEVTQEEEAGEAWRREVACKISLQPPETSSAMSAAGDQTTMLHSAQHSALAADAEIIMVKEEAEEEAVGVTSWLARALHHSRPPPTQECVYECEVRVEFICPCMVLIYDYLLRQVGCAAG